TGVTGKTGLTINVSAGAHGARGPGDDRILETIMVEKVARMNPRERFEILQSLHVPGLDTRVDEFVELCKLVMDRKPQDELTAGLIETGIQLVVNSKDQAEVKEQRAQMTPEEREICETIERMTDDQLRQFADDFPEHGEFVASLLFARDEIRRLTEDA